MRRKPASARELPPTSRNSSAQPWHFLSRKHRNVSSTSNPAAPPIHFTSPHQSLTPPPPSLPPSPPHLQSTMPPKRASQISPNASVPPIPKAPSSATSSSSSKSSSAPTQTAQTAQTVLFDLWQRYLNTTPQRVKLIDVFMAFLVVVGGLQFVYCVLVGNYVCLVCFCCLFFCFLLASVCLSIYPSVHLATHKSGCPEKKRGGGGGFGR